MTEAGARRGGCYWLHHGLAGIATVLSLTLLIINAVNLLDDGYCYIGKNSEKKGLCNFIYALVAISWAVTIVLHLFQCMALGFLRCGGGHWADVLLSLFNCIWWAVGAGVIGVGVGSADAVDAPSGHWRHVALALIWVNFLIFLLLAVAGASRNTMKSMVGAPEQRV